MELSRVDTIKEWLLPTSFRDIQVFLGFANFYRCRPHINAQRRNPRQIQSQVLRHFDPLVPIQIETDASGFAISAILSQPYPETGHWHPVAFWSCEKIPAEKNYGGKIMSFLHLICENYIAKKRKKGKRKS